MYQPPFQPLRRRGRPRPFRWVLAPSPMPIYGLSPPPHGTHARILAPPPCTIKSAARFHSASFAMRSGWLCRFHQSLFKLGLPSSLELPKLKKLERNAIFKESAGVKCQRKSAFSGRRSSVPSRLAAAWEAGGISADSMMPGKRRVQILVPEEVSTEMKKVKDSKMPAKRRMKILVPEEESTETKKVKVSHPSHCSQPGLVLTLGQGNVGQLGLGEDIMERKKPALVTLPEMVVQVEAGGMHTVCLSQTGKIYTFGCNDEGALGRDTSAEGSESSPGLVELQEKVVQVSAGDSHTAALTEDGRVFVWGSFRDNNGVIGLLEPMKTSSVPVLLQLNTPVVKIVSGNDHLVMLTVDGDLFTCGCGEQGQLGRVPALFATRGGRRGLERMLVPQLVPARGRGRRSKMRFQDAFCGAYFTFAVTREGHIYGFGLSNYHQLGTQDTEPCFSPQNLTSFKNSTKSWVGFSGGQHHTVCVDSEGKAYSLGRAEYGRLGLGTGAEEKSTPTVIPELPSIVSVACGASVGYAVSSDGRAFAWGMGTNYQLGTGEEDDVWSPVEMTGKQLENRRVLAVSSGGQHTVLLVSDKEQS